MFGTFGKLVSMPFAALLRWLYATTGSYGLAIILFSLLVTLVMLPFQMKSKRSMVRMGRLSSKQAELQKRYAKDQQKYQEEVAKLYQEARLPTPSMEDQSKASQLRVMKSERKICS